MTERGCYAGGLSYDLPDDWEPLGQDVLQIVRRHALAAISGEDAVGRLLRFYDRQGEFAGTTFLDVEPNPPETVAASDLFAVSRLSISVTNLQARLLLDNGAARDLTEDILSAIPPEATITKLNPDLLGRMGRLQNHFRRLLSSDGHQSNHWVFAAKLCARKRPRLLPVRDSVVCRYLSGGQQLAGSMKHLENGRLGWFSSDIQAFAFLASDNAIASRLQTLAATMESSGVDVDRQPLRLLDSLLWTKGQGYGAQSSAEQ